MAHNPRHQSREMREAGLRRHAQSVLKECGQTGPRIDLHRLVIDRSEIRVCAKELHGACDGLLRWSEKARRFYLYYDPNPFKARFNLAHELAHYFIDEHHHAIRSGEGFHKSNKRSFVGHPRMEAEANLYAAELQIPGFLIHQQEVEPCIVDVLKVAADFDASLQCAARKIIEHSSIPSAMIVSRNRAVVWGCWNGGLVAHGVWGVVPGQRIPIGTPTERAHTHGSHQVGSSQAGQWFENARYRMPLREEAIASPGHHAIITLLSEA